MYAMALMFAATLAAQSGATLGPLAVWSITHEGMPIEVYGRKGSDGKIQWDPSDAHNRRALAAAIAARDARRSAPKAKNFGIDPTRLGTGKGSGYTGGGDNASRFIEQAKAHSLQDPASNRLALTIVGTEEERSRILGDLESHPLLKSVRDSLDVQEYAPGEWPVAPDLGFQEGSPAILIQQATAPGRGKVLWRAEDYRMGPDGLYSAIRKAKGYDPSKDPGPGREGAFGIPKAAIAWAVAALSVLLLPTKRGG